MRLNTCIVFGGKSVEHEVSIITAFQFMEHMNKIKYNPIPIYISKDNQMYFSEKMSGIDFFKDDNYLSECKRVELIRKNNKVSMYHIKKYTIKHLMDIDLAILAVHGTNCEDGIVSALFEYLDIPYVGSDLLSSSLSQNKKATKIFLEYNNIPIIAYYSFNNEEYLIDKENVIRECEQLSYPVIVKPVHLGSSVGVNICDNREELIEAINDALLYDNDILIEKAVKNLKEYNCAVIGSSIIQEASNIEEVIKEDKILSYKDKYLNGSKNGSNKGIVNTKRLIPANLPEDRTNEIKQLAIKTFKSLGNSGVSRIDFIYDVEEDKVYVNEINAIPGSFAYYLWDQEQYNYPRLIDQLINISLLCYKRKTNKIYTYDSNILSYTNTSSIKQMK